MTNIFRLILTATVLVGVSQSVVAADAESVAPAISASDRNFFEKEVRPLLVKRCLECHGGTKAGGGLSLQTAAGWRKGGDSGPAIVPGKPDESLLVDAIHYRSLEMPPPDKGGRLPAEEIAILTKWIELGAPDPRDGTDILGGMTREDARKWWAFQPLPVLDTTADLTADVQHIDDLISREIRQRGLKTASKADQRTLIRRLTYDLTGLPPTFQQIQAFMAETHPDAWEQAIEERLNSPQYGVQWGRHWLDVVRYADTAGENTDRPLPHAWRYRNWVIDAFNRDMPFDQFVRWQLAGDLLAQEKSGPEYAEGVIATGYLAIARRFGHDIDKDAHLTYEDVIDNLGKNFLGLSLGCARCHDHKYDPISSHDYYALYGIFDSTRFAFPGCEPKGQPRDLVPLLPQKDVEALMQPWQRRVAEVEAEKQRRQLAAKAAAEHIQKLWETTKHSLGTATVAEGASVPFEHHLTVRRGEVLMLTVSPNANHGADSTLVEWKIQSAGSSEQSWSVSDLVSDLLSGNPRITSDVAAWSFLEVTSSPTFLTERRESNGGSSAIKSWSLGSEPSVFVNSSDQPANVWTTLPAKSFFVHPGPNRPVAVAWTSPIDAEIVLTGRVADAHPAGLDGVAFQLDYFASEELGPLLAELSNASVGLPDAGPAPAIPVAYAVVDREARNARYHQRGDPEQLGEEVPRRWLTVFGGTEVPGQSGSGRRELAEWVASQPLMARVMANRIWEWHFGQGLVRSSNDFGARGEAPSHPELLDFLAARFVQSGYSVKALHRLILHTEAYQRASATPDAADPDNRWLAHFHRRRLTAEELRDSLLTVSGQLDRSPGVAHPFPAEHTWTFTQHAPFHAVYETDRRSVYLMVQRQRRHPFLALFDGADPNASTPLRQTTTVPTQALYFINDPFFHAQAQRLAEVLVSLPDDAERLEQAHRMVFQREPTPAERDRLQRFVTNYPGETLDKWSAIARVMLASNEFLYVE